MMISEQPHDATVRQNSFGILVDLSLQEVTKLRIGLMDGLGT
jgi:hypothetical protein